MVVLLSDEVGVLLREGVQEDQSEGAVTITACFGIRHLAVAKNSSVSGGISDVSIMSSVMAYFPVLPTNHHADLRTTARYISSAVLLAHRLLLSLRTNNEQAEG